VLTQLLYKILFYTIQHTTYLLPRELLSDVLRPMYLSHDKPINH